MNLQRLFSPKNIVVYGGQWSDYVVDQCQKLGFPGNLWRIHPSREDCFRDLSELPGVPDSAFLGVNRELTVSALKDLCLHGLGGAVLFASGFGEVEDGTPFQEELDNIPGDLPFIGPNCYGFINFFDRVALWPDQVVGHSKDRGVAIISQSGTISITLMAQQRSLPVGYVISVGNQQRLAAEDLIKFCAEDERVSAIGLYLEGIRNVSKFMEAVEQARVRQKPIALIKVGKSEKGKEIAMTHTGALTGSEALHDALFERLGVARCEDLSTLVETLKLLHVCGPLPHRKIFLMGASGGDIAMTADLSKGLDLELPPPSDEIKKKIQPNVGERVVIDNPLDFQTATWFELPRMRKMFETVFESGYSMNSLMLDPPDENESDTKTFDDVIELFLEESRLTQSNAGILSSLPESFSKRIREQAMQAGVVPQQGLPEALRSLHHASRIGKNWKQDLRPKLLLSESVPESSRFLTEFEAKSMFREAGLPVPQGRLVTAEEAPDAADSIGYPLVVKASSVEMLHKSEHGGVCLGLSSREEVCQALNQMKDLSETFLVEEMVTDTVTEVLLGLQNDPQFGLSLTLGAGGIYTELLEDTSVLLFPVSEDLIMDSLEQLKLFKIIQGWRGKPKGDLGALVKAVLDFARFAEQYHHKLVQAEINPLAILPEGKGVKILDALIEIKEN